jgi:hypothetical protein
MGLLIASIRCFIVSATIANFVDPAKLDQQNSWVRAEKSPDLTVGRAFTDCFRENPAIPSTPVGGLP